MVRKIKILPLLIFFTILVLGAYLRLSNLNWDHGQHMHPDERFLTLVTTGIEWPSSVSEYFNTDLSPLNPHNRNHAFYVYGTLPLFIVKYLADLFGQTGYDKLTYVGREVSALLEIGIILLVYLIARNTTKNIYAALMSMFLYALFITPIQTAHYFTVDSYLGFFTALCLFFISSAPTLLRGVFLGLSFGLLLASKISGAYLLPVILVGYSLYFFKTKKYLTVFISLILFCITGSLTVRIAQPYLFKGPSIWNVSFNPKILNNWKELEMYNTPKTRFPPALQWLPTKPYAYHLTQQSVWAIGLPIIFTVLFAGIVSLYRLRNKIRIQNLIKIPIPLSLLVLWIIMLWIYQGAQFAKPLRYLYPTHAAMSIVFGLVIVTFINNLKLSSFKSSLFIFIFCSICVWWTMSVTSFYRRPLTRYTASEWILSNIVPGKNIAFEHWDDPIPLHIPAAVSPEQYVYTELTLYHDDTPDKWRIISEQLPAVDYIVMTSNRLWRSLSQIPDQYPYAQRYYRLLANGGLGFTPINVFSSYPCFIPGNSSMQMSELSLNLFPPPVSLVSTSYCRLGLNDDGAEESFTVYDHPKVIIYQNTSYLPAPELFRRITEL